MPNPSHAARDPSTANDSAGFALLQLTMRDAATGALLWESVDWPDAPPPDTVIDCHLPAAILAHPIIARELTFASRSALSNLSLTQEIYYHRQLIEKWNFEFGFVIPESTNSWQCTIVKGTSDDIDNGPSLTAAMLNGNVVIHTRFLNDGAVVYAIQCRLYYDQ